MSFSTVNLRWLGFAAALGYWLLESVLHAFVWDSTATFWEAMAAEHDQNELWMRIVISVLLVAFGHFAEINRHRLIKDIHRQQKTNRMLRFLSDCNQNVQRHLDEQVLLDAACASAVDVGEFRFAWIGMQQGDELKLVACAAADKAIAKEVGTLQEPGALISCLSCQTVLKEGVLQLCKLKDRLDCTAPWLPSFLKIGCEHAIALPLIVGGRTLGVFEVYAGENGQIADDEGAILDEVADDISVALNNIRVEADRRQKAEELAARVEELERFQRATVDREFRIKELRDEITALKDEKR